MASKCYVKNQKEKSPKQNGKTYQDALPDEIALRDEILDLKRQMIVLKKTNEQNLVKFRKYEDEAKRKDRQIEQLMDPTKNTDIRKILSTKGAAILMNLKDQNNALIQMILDKDLQIKRLLGELKTSKLYASSRKTEPYRIEIARLRNLLIKSQELLKEATDVPQKRSICVGGTPVLEMTSSSDQSSPRELEELRFTIQSLETHMKYSNELLSKKNQEIMILTDQLNAARNAYQCKTCSKNMTIKPSYEYDFDPKKYDWFQLEKSTDETRLQEIVEAPRSQSADQKLKEDTLSLPQPQRPKSSSAELLELFERTMTVKERKIKTKIPKSAPVGSDRNSDSKDSQSRRSSMPVLTEKSNGYQADESNEQTTHEPISTEEPTDLSFTMSNGTSEDLEKSLSKHLTNREKRRSKSLLHDLATNSLEECERKSEKTQTNKEKWRNAVKKLKKSNRRKKSEPSFASEKLIKMKDGKRKSLIKNDEKQMKISDASGNDTELEELEMYEFEMMEKKIEHDQVEIESVIKSNQESPRSGISPKFPDGFKLKRQNHVSQTEDSVVIDENKNEAPSTSRKVVISKESILLPRRSSTKGESPGKSKIAVASSRKSSTSSTSKSTSTKSESSSKKSVGKSPRDLSSRRSKKLSRSKNVEEPPVPLQRTKITKSVSLDKIRGKTPSPTIPSSRRHSDQTNVEVEKPVEPEKVTEMLDEIIKYETSSGPVSDTQQIKQEINNISSRFSPEIQKELQSLYDNITSFEEIENKKAKSLREVYKQSVDSSFDSENSSMTRQEPKIVEVEVEINQAPMQSSESIQSQEELSCKSREKKDGGENFFDGDDDDDDDVILG